MAMLPLRPRMAPALLERSVQGGEAFPAVDFQGVDEADSERDAAALAVVKVAPPAQLRVKVRPSPSRAIR